jgi:hypothetical protein
MTLKCASALAAGSASQVVSSGAIQLDAQLGMRPEIIFAFASVAQPLNEVLQGLRQKYPRTLVVGASSAGEFSNREELKSATSLFALGGDIEAHAALGVGLRANAERAAASVHERLPKQIVGLKEQTAVVLLDPLAGVSEETTLSLAALLGDRVQLAGGAAGDDLKLKQCRVGLNDEVQEDAMVVVKLFTKNRAAVGIAHGHKPLSEPLIVTSAEGSVVRTINDRPAWEVWREQTRDAARIAGIDVERLPTAEQGAFLLRFEAGLASGAAYKVRAPLSVGERGALNFACGVPQGSTFRIMQSDRDGQVDSARRAAEQARARLGQTVGGALVFDCICRNLILGDRFAQALGHMHDALDRAPMSGFETYGEVALDATDFSGFHNTTSVVLAFGKE